MNIDIKVLKSKLQELAGTATVKVKFDRSLKVGTSIRQYETAKDMGFIVKLNPAMLRSPHQLEEALTFCRDTVGG